jgi:hypothetical protein
MFVAMRSQTHAGPDLSLRILHAESYPFARPACSYLFASGGMRPLPPDACRGRTPVLASGSNAAPERLAAKFGFNDEVPVTRAVLHDFVVAFAGHFTAYGAIPATLYPSPGAQTLVWITWLTTRQLELMHRSEGVIACREANQRYDYVKLESLDLRPEGVAPIGRAGAYLSRRMLAPHGTPVRFAEAPSKGGSLRAWSHPSTLRRAAAWLAPKQAFAVFMAEVLSGVERRQALFERLSPYTIDRPKELGP